jgi:hypothetical protein
MDEEQYEICDQGPCWDKFIYVGPEPGIKGSCISREKLCKLEEHECLSVCSEDSLGEEPKDFNSYNECLKDAQKRFDKGDLKLCPRGYCTAKHKFEVYPSAYANGHAVQICKGKKPCYEELTEEDEQYMLNLQSKNEEKENSDLNRWYQEKWVNLCEQDPDGPEGFAVCGSGKGIDNPEDYPYCRAYHKLEDTEVVTVEELKENLDEDEFNDLIEDMCSKKQSLERGVDGKPTRINLPKKITKKIKDARKKGGACIKIPEDVQIEANISLDMKEQGFEGGTDTGIGRAEQLANDDCIDLECLAAMRTWFARHGPDAKNGGTSYPGYLKWKKDGCPMSRSFNEYRGAVSWLLWGGDAAYKWLKTPEIRELLEKNYPNRKTSSRKNNLSN